MSLLQEMTNYAGGCNADDAHIKNLWIVLKERFDPFERARFLEFVWGRWVERFVDLSVISVFYGISFHTILRSRLPLTKSGFTHRFQITLYRTDTPDEYLPVSHTCFFSMELPKYSTIEIMHEKLLYAITHCVAIDADGNALFDNCHLACFVLCS